MQMTAKDVDRAIKIVDWIPGKKWNGNGELDKTQIEKRKKT